MITIPEKVEELFPKLKILNTKELEDLDSGEIENYMEKLKNIIEDIRYKKSDMKAKIENLETEKEETLSKIKEHFGVDDLEGLEKLKSNKLKELDKAIKSLEDGLKEFEDE